MRISDWSSDVCSSDLEEQKALLREVYHRVKNNLQVVSSLVNLQVSRATNEHERTALRITQDRIHALSMVHGNLSDSPELHRIVLTEFVPPPCASLRPAQGAPGEKLPRASDIHPVLPAQHATAPVRDTER